MSDQQVMAAPSTASTVAAHSDRAQRATARQNFRGDEVGHRVHRGQTLLPAQWGGLARNRPRVFHQLFLGGHPTGGLHARSAVREELRTAGGGANDAQRQAATDPTYARKLKEIRIALTLDKELGKQEILTRYLNLVPFGSGAYGIQTAAQTYFGINAADLNAPQSAMLAGMVQSSSVTPYTNPEAVLARRNLVLDTMQTNGVLNATDTTTAKATPLGVLPHPRTVPNGCVGAAGAQSTGFFCSYVLKYHADAGISPDQVNKGGYTIKTTLDPAVQAAAKAATTKYAPADLNNIASVMNIVQPGQTSHKVLAT